ncbi:antirestriction protein ArdA [Lacticaseibacillus jixianensis]|uniref:Antirestriction protein ArdA n=1 Tax=Lacticaseibacillus jixianensis TaxID=2486012 RepID=A0ABW4B802_9LACO|nr:antirestriction protein ArdA [Lacticaseibacillus jixianensis]
MAAKFRVWIANLGKYNEGESVGAWFEPPINWDDMAEQISLNEQYEEYAIHDYDAPFPISEYDSIDHINALGDALDQLNNSELGDVVEELLDARFDDVIELAEHIDDFVHYDADSMEDLAIMLVQNGDFCGEVPEQIQSYIDYEKLANDLEADGIYVTTHDGIYEYLN